MDLHNAEAIEAQSIQEGTQGQGYTASQKIQMKSGVKHLSALL